MQSYISSTRFSFALALVVPTIALTWLLAQADTLGTFSSVLVAALFAGFATVVIVTHKNAQANGSVAQLLYEVEADAAVVRPTAPQTRRKT